MAKRIRVGFLEEESAIPLSVMIPIEVLASSATTSWLPLALIIANLLLRYQHVGYRHNRYANHQNSYCFHVSQFSLNNSSWGCANWLRCFLA